MILQWASLVRGEHVRQPAKHSFWTAGGSSSWVTERLWCVMLKSRSMLMWSDGVAHLSNMWWRMYWLAMHCFRKLRCCGTVAEQKRVSFLFAFLVIFQYDGKPLIALFHNFIQPYLILHDAKMDTHTCNWLLRIIFPQTSVLMTFSIPFLMSR
jgi:hypothetical protein